MIERGKLMLAVVEAARRCVEDNALSFSFGELVYAVAALDAHTPEREGDMVEVRAAVLVSPDGTLWSICGTNDRTDDEAANIAKNELAQRSETFSCVITARVPIPRIPTIPATVERAHD